MTRRLLLPSALLLVICQALPSTSSAMQCSAAAVASGGASAVLQAASAETCAEYWSGNLPFAGKEAAIRTQVSLPLPAGFEVQVQEGLLAADDTLRKLGSGVGLGQSVVVIISGVDPLDDEGDPWDVVGYAEFLDGHCYFVVTPNTWRDPGARQELKITMAHELFHCVQAASLPYELLVAGETDDTDQNAWWIEGSAEWFGILTQPALDRSGLAVDYENNADSTPLNDFGVGEGSEVPFAEHVWPFFAWYSEKHGADAVLPLLRGLPRRPHDPGAIAALMDDADWDDFTTQYAAFQIWMSGLGPVDPSVRASREVDPINVDGAFSVPRNTAQLSRKEFVLHSGRWRLRGDPSTTAMHFSSVKANGDPDGAWIRLAGEQEVRTLCEEEKRIVVAGFGNSNDSFVFNAEKIDDDCEAKCEGIPDTLDACLVGVWEETNHIPDASVTGFHQNMIELKYPAPTHSFAADGSYTYDSPFYMKNWVAAGGRRITMVTHYLLNQAKGHWGSRGSTLSTCENREVTRGIFIKEGIGSSSLNGDQPAEPRRETDFTFACEADTLIISSERLGITRGVLKRVSGP